MPALTPFLNYLFHDLFPTLLKTGANAHASAFGSMTDVTNHSTQGMNDQDLAAISTYLKSLAEAGGMNAPAHAYDSKGTAALRQHPANDAGAKVCRILHALPQRGWTRVRTAACAAGGQC